MKNHSAASLTKEGKTAGGTGFVEGNSEQ